MRIPDISEEWLRQQTFTVTKGLTISDVYFKKLDVKLDGRGDVVEMWSQPWVNDQNVLQPRHVYQSATDFGVVKCWHLHDQHTDQFVVTRGKLQVSLVDLREGSPTYLHANKLFLGIQNPAFLKIPAGIMHGWKALSEPEVLVVNFQTDVFDPTDEYRFAWNSVLENIWEPQNG